MTDNENIEKFIKWSKVCTILSGIFSLFGIGAGLLAILKEFTDLEEKAPFFYGKVFGGILIGIFLTFFALEIFCYVKARKYKKLIGEIEDEEGEETNDR